MTEAVVDGTILMVVCAAAALAGTWMFNYVWPHALPGKFVVIVPCAPLTAIAVFAAAVSWARRARASIAEAVGALVGLEFTLYGMVAAVTGLMLAEITFRFWLVASLAVAPWWLLGVWSGLVMGRKRSQSS